MSAPRSLLAAALLAAAASPAAAQGLLTGTVRTAGDAPVACALVDLQPGGHGTVADSLGRFRFYVPASLARGDSLRLRVWGPAGVSVDAGVRRAPRMRLDVRLPADSSADAQAAAQGCEAMRGGYGLRRASAAITEGAMMLPSPPPPPPPPSPMPPGVVADAVVVTTGSGRAGATRPATAGESRAVAGSPSGAVPTAADSVAEWRRAGVLTASVWDDFRDAAWTKYADFVQRHARGEAAGLALVPGTPAVLRLTAGGRPLADHPVTLEQGERRYELRTGPGGEIRVFPASYHPLVPGDVRVTAGGAAPFTWRLPPIRGDERPVTTRAVRARHRRAAPVLDIGLMIDATGSMGDEMTYIQSELRDVIARAIPASSGIQVRLSVVYYRDRGDEFVTRSLPFTDDVDEVVSFLGRTEAMAGGDYPEEMNAALGVMVGQEWSAGPAARMLFVVADAPPHPYEGAEYTYQDALRDLPRKGIAVYPVAASGVDRQTEYLMRALAVASGGKHIFLTDDSGVGNPHLRPEVGAPPVEKLNELLIREIRDYARRAFPSALRADAGR